MEIGIFAKTFAGTDPETVLAAARASGYTTVQYNMACSGLPSLPEDVPDATVAAIASAMKRNEVSLCALSATWNMAHPDAAIRAAGLRSLGALAPVARTMRIPILTLCTGSRDARDQWAHHPDNASPAAWREMLDTMGKAIQIAEQHDLRLGIEPELANVISSAHRARELLDTLRSDRLCIVLDAANLFEVSDLASQHRIVAESVDVLAPDIAMAHAKDRAADGTFVTAGMGVLDYDHYLACLDRIGFAGPIITHGLSADEAPSVAAFLQTRMAAAR